MSGVQWGLLGQGFDPMEALRYAGQARQQRVAEQQLQRQEEQRQQQQAARAQVVQRLGANDYQGATQAALEGGDFDLVKHIGGLQADRQKQLAEEARRIAGLAYSLRGQPVENRRAVALQAAQTFGIDPTHIPEDLSDQSLQGIYGWATDIEDQVKAKLGEARIADIGTDNERQERVADNSIAATNTRLKFAANADARGAAANVRAAQDRAALAAGGHIVRNDLDDLDY